MKKALLLAFILLTTFLFKATAQTTAPTKVQKELTDSVCNCVNKIDVDKITTKQEAIEAYTTCITRNVVPLKAWADERGIDFTDTKAMEALGVELATDLMKQDCKGFIKLATKMANSSKNEATAQQTSTGTFKRIDLKGFNYIVITDASGSERSFIWLRQFPGSEQFMGPTLKFAGKKLKISWQEVEVYLPAAKGYYKVKEITSINVL